MSDQQLFTLVCKYLEEEEEKTLSRVFDTLEEAKVTAGLLEAFLVNIIDNNNVSVYTFDANTHEYPAA